MMMSRSSLNVLVQLAARGATVAHRTGGGGARPFGRSFLTLVVALTVATTVGIVTTNSFAGPLGADHSGTVIIDTPDAPLRLLWLRADQADGSGPYAEGTRANPWVDLARGNNGEVWNFRANTASGWAGDGSIESPHRLVFNGREERVAIAAGSVPELQEIGPVTAEVWFKTGFDGASQRYDYVLEWVQQPTPDFDPFWEGRGMSIVVQNGRIQVYANPWIDAGEAKPNTWYHVAVAKDENDLRIYVDGREVYRGSHAHQGIQQSEIVLGASTFRAFEPVGFYGDFGDIAIAQVAIWNGALHGNAVRALYDANRALYQEVSSASLTKALDLRAASANGNTPQSPPSSGIEWTDLTIANEAVLHNFDGTATSGWLGNGGHESPHRLQFDGIDDVVAVPAGSIGELQNVSAVSAAIWFQTPSTLPSSETDYEYLIDWLEGFDVGNGMALAIHEGQLKLWGRNTENYPFNRSWMSVAPLDPDRWYHIAATKQPGEVTVYVNGRAYYSGAGTELGDATTEITIGASTWRGEGQYADHFSGAVGEVRLWRGTLSPDQVMDDVHAGAADYFPVAIPRRHAEAEASTGYHRLSLAGLQSNPAVGNLRVSFTLAHAGPAKLELLDVSGRRVTSRSVGTFGAGQHSVDLSEGRGMPTAGVYFVRLTQDGQSLVRKAVVVRP